MLHLFVPHESKLTDRSKSPFCRNVLLSNFDLGPDVPGSRGKISSSAGTVAEILKENDYSTFAVGKWHLTPTYEETPAGPFQNWPLGKGFDRYYGFLEGMTDQYNPSLVYDNHNVEPPKKPDYHLSEDLVDHSIKFISRSCFNFSRETVLHVSCLWSTAFTAPSLPKLYRYVQRNI